MAAAVPDPHPAVGQRAEEPVEGGRVQAPRRRVVVAGAAHPRPGGHGRRRVPEGPSEGGGVPHGRRAAGHGAAAGRRRQEVEVVVVEAGEERPAAPVHHGGARRHPSGRAGVGHHAPRHLHLPARPALQLHVHEGRRAGARGGHGAAPVAPPALLPRPAGAPVPSPAGARGAATGWGASPGWPTAQPPPAGTTRWARGQPGPALA